MAAKDTPELHPDDDPWERAPRNNPALLGQEQAEAALLDCWQSGRMPHAWVLAGARGIGKATLAFRFARFVLAKGMIGGGGQAGGLFGAEPASLEIPPTDRIFQRIASLGHSDLRYVRRAVNRKTGKLRQEISIDDVRDMGSFLRLTAGEGGWRIVIIDSADEMTRQAANAALKVIEEPPPRALILLVSHAPGRLLPTIRSRCRVLPLRALDHAAIKQVVNPHLPDLAPDELDELARLADGSAGRALTLADHGGIEVHRDMLAMLANYPRVDELAMDRIGDRLSRSGAEAGFRVFGEMLTGLLARLCRDARLGHADGGHANGGHANGGHANGGAPETPNLETPVQQRMAGAAGLDRWLEVWEKLSELFARAESAKLDRKQVVVDAVLTVAGAARM